MCVTKINHRGEGPGGRQ